MKYQSVIFFSIFTVTLMGCFICIGLIFNIKSTSLLKKNRQLNNQIKTVKQDIDKIELKISRSLNLKEIDRKAIEIGMVKPKDVTYVKYDEKK